MLKKCCDALYKATGVVITAGLFSIVILVFLQVISRYVFKFSINWAQELTVYILIWLVFLGCSMGMRDNEVASLTIVTDRLPNTGKWLCAMAVNILMIMFLAVTILANREIIAFAMRRTSPVMKIKMGYISSAYSVSSLFTILYCIEKILQLSHIHKGGEFV